MSEVILDTITGKSTATTITIGSTPVVSASANSMTIRGEGSNQTSIQQGIAKVWTLWNASGTPAHRDSFNAGSITDHGTGEQTVAFTTSMASADFTCSGQVGNGNDSDTSNAQMRRASSATGSQRCTICYASGGTTAAFDYAYCSLVVHGDLS
tara:strand:- start:435 stop:893 length:459 start_codon:yes stop_codon:yes gene_type:complete